MANQLIKAKEPHLMTVPGILYGDFEEMVLQSYFDGGYLDLHNLTDQVDMFAIYSVSEEETGSPFTLVNDPEWMELSSERVCSELYYDVLQDVSEILDCHRMFYAWKDIGEDHDCYKFIGEFYNLPVLEIW